VYNNDESRKGIGSMSDRPIM